MGAKMTRFNDFGNDKRLKYFQKRFDLIDHIFDDDEKLNIAQSYWLNDRGFPQLVFSKRQRNSPRVNFRSEKLDNIADISTEFNHKEKPTSYAMVTLPSKTYSSNAGSSKAPKDDLLAAEIKMKLFKESHKSMQHRLEKCLHDHTEHVSARKKPSRNINFVLSSTVLSI